MGLCFHLATIIRKEMKPASFKLSAPGFLVVSRSQSTVFCSWGYLAMSETFLTVGAQGGVCYWH